MAAEQRDRPVPSTGNMVPLSPPITPALRLSRLISSCHLVRRVPFFFLPSSTLFLPSPFLNPPPPFFYWRSTFQPSCFTPLFLSIFRRSLNPLSFALLGPSPPPPPPPPPSVPLPALPETFPRAVPFPPTPRRFPSFFLIHFLSAIRSIHPLSPPTYICGETHCRRSPPIGSLVSISHFPIYFFFFCDLPNFPPWFIVHLSLCLSIRPGDFIHPLLIHPLL